MHRSPVLQRSPIDDDNRPRRELHSSAQVYDARSPTTTQRAPSHHYSPPSATKALPPYDYQYTPRPSTAGAAAHQPVVNQSPRLGPPPSPTSNGHLSSNGQLHYSNASFGMRDQGSSTFYDPTQEHREASASWNNTRATTSPTQSRQSEPYYDRNSDPKLSRSSYQSPTSTRFPNPSPTFSNLHAHPSSRHNSVPQSPPYPSRPSPTQQYNHLTFTGPTNGALDRSVIPESGRDTTAHDHEAFQQETRRTRADPMAFSSILSDAPVETPKSTSKNDPPIKQFRKVSRPSHTEPTPPASVPRSSSNNAERQPAKEAAVPIVKRDPESRKTLAKESKAAMSKSTSVFRVPTKVEQKESEKLAKTIKEIDEMELSDIDLPEFVHVKAEVEQRGQKRELEIQHDETQRRKRRCMMSAKKASILLQQYALGGKQRFAVKHGNQASEEVHEQEILDEKERKKDMQRKRRREKTIMNETQKQQEAIAKAQSAGDIVEREKHLKEAQRAEKKAKITRRILEVGESVDTIPEVNPMGLNLEGGTMIDFQAGVNPSPEPLKKKTGRGQSTRLKKSKEKKQAEKDMAEAAWAAHEQDQLQLTHIAPKIEPRKEVLIKEAKEVKSVESTPAPVHTTNFASKGYHQMYEQIFRDIGRKEILKVYRIRDNSKSAKLSNKGKTAQLACKESRRWQLRTNKSTKDTQARSKRGMKEMMSFWKRNEREERDMRRVAEKQELDNAKKAEADREANRQKRKLNFLIKQTELYSHFVGSKIKTSELERSTDINGGTTASTAETSSHPQMPLSSANKTTKTMEDIDFDNEDETELNEVAAGNAYSAVQEAQNRARAFNNEEGDLQAQFDDSEMNFQNPAGFGDMEVEQPKMLTVPLKEYQLKGLNWLVNIYEQGINGILADEMGLGKTVQSISVMGYLAEKHNIWGPFLVIAPLSTLHNWEQEIRRFVPDLRVLPYWGNAKDRKTLRKQWDRKHITYGRDTPFHVTITSYQLVVLDAQYFQKMRWQYMILDEAQAIKSSQSSRWKSLLGFHCRNRLLLTGTPIQNNMQELWALLHFIMPSLFDSHDEFSDWFSKDIESHAQSNTKLNEDQLKRLHMILKPFMLRRLKSNVQKELGDKIELDVFCDLTYRQRAYYGNLRNKISIMDLIEKATVGDDHDTATLMNLVMQFRKVCNHPDLFERAETASPLSLAHFAETASFVREGSSVNLAYSTRNLIEYDLPRLLCQFDGDEGTKHRNLDAVDLAVEKPDFVGRVSTRDVDIWNPSYIHSSQTSTAAFSWLRFSDTSATEASQAFRQPLFDRALSFNKQTLRLARMRLVYDEEVASSSFTPAHAMLNIVSQNDRKPLAEISQGPLQNLMNISQTWFQESPFPVLEQCARPRADAPPIQISCSNQAASIQSQNEIFNPPIRKALYGLSHKDEQALLDAKVQPANFPPHSLLPAPESEKARFTNISVPSMRRFVTDSGKLAKLDALLRELKNGSHRVLLYFQMTRMIDLMEEYLTYRNYKYCRLDGSTKLEDRRDTVHDFQTRPEIFIFLLSTRAGGLGINLTSADTVIFYDSDWNPTIDSQAMDRAHRLGQTKQVTVYRMITRGTIEERIRKRALQKEEVQRVVISGGQSSAGVDFNTRSKENRTKDIAMWLANEDEAELIEKKEAELAEKGEDAPEKKGKGKGKKAGTGGRKKDVSLEEMYHEGEGHFNDESGKPSGAATPIDGPAEAAPKGKRGGKGSRGGSGVSKKAKTAKQRLAIADGA